MSFLPIPNDEREPRRGWGAFELDPFTGLPRAALPPWPAAYKPVTGPPRVGLVEAIRNEVDRFPMGGRSGGLLGAIRDHAGRASDRPRPDRQQRVGIAGWRRAPVSWPRRRCVRGRGAQDACGCDRLRPYLDPPPTGAPPDPIAHEANPLLVPVGPRFREGRSNAFDEAVRSHPILRQYLYGREKNGIALFQHLAPFDELPSTADGPEAFLDSAYDSDAVFKKLEKIRKDRKILDLEWHHPLPHQFKRFFSRAGITDEERERLAYYVWKTEHRGRMVGAKRLHPEWNAAWQSYFSKPGEPSREAILDHLTLLLAEFP